MGCVFQCPYCCCSFGARISLIRHVIDMHPCRDLSVVVKMGREGGCCRNE